MDPIVPRMASDGGGPSLIVSPRLETTGSRALPSAIAGLRLEITDVLLHEPESDTWMLLNDHSAQWEPFDSTAKAPAFSGVPLHPGTYDAIEVHFGSAQVDVSGKWTDASLAQESIKIDQVIKLAQDVHLSVLFDFADAVAQAKGNAWTVTPALSISLERE